MIRAATSDDIGALVAMARRFHRTAQYSEWSLFDGGVCDAMLRAMLDDEASAVFIDGEFRGAIGVSIGPLPYSPQETRVERFWWVDPDNRGIGMHLYKAADAWAVARGVEIRSLVAPWKAHDVHRLYERMGYAPVEITFVKV